MHRALPQRPDHQGKLGSMRRRTVGIVVGNRASAARRWRRRSPAVFGVAMALVLSGSAGATGSSRTQRSPQLPASIAQRGHLTIGVKCDLPPFGYLDAQGRHVGYDVEIAQQLSEAAFHQPDRIRYVCVTTTSRIPALQSGRIDMIIATLSWTKARARMIGYSTPYFEASGRLLVRAGSGITSPADLGGKTVVTTRGSVYVTWARSCLKGTTVQQVDGIEAAVTALTQGRASGVLYDDAYLLGLVHANPSLEIASTTFLPLPWGIGVKKNATALRAWINAALAQLQAGDEFERALESTAPLLASAGPADQVPRPNTTLHYPSSGNPLTDCTAS